jgi:putative hydrolase of HD superfamily
MEKKFNLNLDLLANLAGSPLLAAYVEINHLKQLYRQGWLRAGIPREQCESVADHVFAMAMLAWLVIDGGLAPQVNREKVLRMVLVHELGEIYTGDITPVDHVPPEKKHQLELDGLERVADKLPAGFDFLELWEEFEAGASEEARLVRQLDRLEMAFQALVYEKQGSGGRSMDSFFQSAQSAVKDAGFAAMLETVKSLRS